MIQVAHCNTAAEAWVAITEIFISQTQAHIVNTRIALSMTKKGNLTVAEYFGRMKALGDEMASAGKPLTDDDMVSYILAGLDFDYMGFVSSLCARAEPIKVNELYSLLVGFENMLTMFDGGHESSHSSANAVSRGERGGPNRGGGRGGNGGRYGGGRGNGGGGRGQGSGGGRGNGGEVAMIFRKSSVKSAPSRTTPPWSATAASTSPSTRRRAWRPSTPTTPTLSPPMEWIPTGMWTLERQITSPASSISSPSGTSTTGMIK